MGCVKTIGYNKFPRQGNWLGKRVKVCFFYNSDKCIGGKIVREDYEEPFLTMLSLDDGRYVLATEC